MTTKPKTGGKGRPKNYNYLAQVPVTPEQKEELAAAAAAKKQSLPADETAPKGFVTVARAEQWLVEKSREDCATFIEYVSGRTLARHHRIWLANIFHPERSRLNFIAPRESAKSTIMIYALAWVIAKAPLLTHAVISVSASQAEDRLRMVRSILTSVRFKNVFPWIAIDTAFPDTQTQLTVLSRENNMPYNVWRSQVARLGSLKDPTLLVSGNGGRGIIGRRFSGLLLLDDIIDETYLKDELQEKVMKYIVQTLLPCVQSTGKVINIGTRWMLNDVPERLINNPAWHSVVIRALETDPTTGELCSYWPEYWPVDTLLKKKAEMANDALFQIMYQNDPSALTASLFTPQSLNRDLPEVLPPLKEVYISTDFAISQKTSADYTVYAALGTDTAGNLYLLDMLRLKASPETLVEELGRFCDRIGATYHRLTAVLIEQVGFQSLLQSYIGNSRPDLPLVPHVPKGDKMHRAKYLSGLAQAGKLFINQKITLIDYLKSEWLNFPLHRHDDTLDAVSLFCQYHGAGVSVRSVRQIKSPFLI